MSYLDFVEEPTELKTKRWSILNKSGGILGTIYYYNHWRNYIFSSIGYGIMFDYKCLAEILEFLKAHKDDRN